MHPARQQEEVAAEAHERQELPALEPELHRVPRVLLRRERRRLRAEDLLLPRRQEPGRDCQCLPHVGQGERSVQRQRA